MEEEKEMKVNRSVKCKALACADVDHALYRVPGIEIRPEAVSIVLISEAAPPRPGDYYYAKGQALFQQTTVQAFNDAGARVGSIQDILDLGVYLTTAIKCAKTAYGIQTATIKECSNLLEKELALFEHVKALLLMGDVAIKAVNVIAQRKGQARVIPAGSTYKLRAAERAYYFREARAFPSYLQAGPSFYIEKTKRKAIAEDIAAALAWAG
jgi:uracil-DNA glycosylase